MSGSLNHSLKAIDLKALIHSGTKHHNCVAQKGCCCFVWKKKIELLEHNITGNMNEVLSKSLKVTL